MTTPTTPTTPLTGIRVLDITDGLGESSSRYLADLGAEVIRIELPGGSASRTAEPIRGGVSIPFALRNANKLGIVLDVESESGRGELRALAAGADILIESLRPGWLDERGIGAAELTAHNPELVWMSISPFGRTGPYRDWAVTEPVLYAMSGVLSRSGAPGREPLLPPVGLAEGTVSVHAAWAALLAYYNRLTTGRGDIIDVSAYEVVVHGFDPGFGTQGSAAAGRTEDFPRGRPNASNFYPVFACADGQVRICLLAKRQWRSMFEWLGSPEEFADPKYDTIPARFAAADRLHPLIAELFAGETRDELVAQGAARGIPVGGVLAPSEVLAAEHFQASGALIDAEIAPNLHARVPSGYGSIGGNRIGFRTRAPQLGEHQGEVAARSKPSPAPAAGRASGERPLTGLRVLDLGVVVFGAELGRQFADFGADVVKIENADFPDGLRQSKRGSALAASVVWGHRNKRSFGVDLRNPEGLALFRQLAADADLVLANFKPGTLKSMGLSYDELAEINPRIIVHESSAFGSTGPWSKRMGYGPLVRASGGVSALWRYPDDAELLCDGSTVYPDHIAAQAGAVAVLATLIQRAHTGTGNIVEVVQSDTALVHLGSLLTAESLAPGSIVASGNSDPYAAPSGVFACAGDDEWCVVTVRDDEDWARLCVVIGREDLVEDVDCATSAARVLNRDKVDHVLSQWLSNWSPAEAMNQLQAAGIPAGAMVRLPELLTDPQLTARNAYTEIEHSLLPAKLPAATRLVRFGTIADPELRQAPIAGEQTREIAESLLGLSSAEVDHLVRTSVLQPPADDRAHESRRSAEELV